MEKKKEEGGKELSGDERYEGYCADLAELVCAELEIKCQLKLVEDNVFGSKDENNGTWNGMVGELTNKVGLRCFFTAPPTAKKNSRQ